MKHLVAISILALGACGGDDAATTPDAPKVTIDAPDIDGPPPPAFVGTWKQVPIQTAASTDWNTVTFGADHVITTTTPSGVKTTAQWELEANGQLKVSDGTYITTGDYFLDANHFMFDVAHPVGTVDGFLGTWHEAVYAGGSAQLITIDLTFAADNSVTGMYNGTALTGTWHATATTVFVDGMIGTTPIHTYSFFLANTAMSDTYYQRTPDE